MVVLVLSAVWTPVLERILNKILIVKEPVIAIPRVIHGNSLPCDDAGAIVDLDSGN